MTGVLTLLLLLYLANISRREILSSGRGKSYLFSVATS